MGQAEAGHRRMAGSTQRNRAGTSRSTGNSIGDHTGENAASPRSILQPRQGTHRAFAPHTPPRIPPARASDGALWGEPKLEHLQLRAMAVEFPVVQIHTELLRAGVLTVDEVRAMRGLAPLTAVTA
ncbi:hypothetical protein BH10ACI4_BH10ACI4_36410 [soil metagenome]